jgi:hypothetical protein
MNGTRARVLLVAILVLAAALRFTGLGWGLRHLPDLDERWFVEAIGRMLAARDLDHRFYEYPGLFFYVLAPVLAFLHPPHFGADAYLAARGVVALFGVAAVALTYVLGARFVGRGAGLAAALLVAVSPVEVFTAHMVRPDVALEVFVLLAFLAFLRLGPDPRGDVLSGVALGAATALKYTGVLLAPSYLVQRLTAPGFRLARLALAAGASLVTFALCSPYTFLHFHEGVRGARSQFSHHYLIRPQGPESYIDMAWTYGLGLMKSFGPIGLALVAAGVLLAVRDGRRWLGLLMYPVVVVGVLSTAEVHFDRHLVPTLGLLSVLAGRAVASIAKRSPLAAVCATLAAAALPLAGSIDYVRGVSVPGTRDAVLEWIDANLPAGSRVVSSVSGLGQRAGGAPARHAVRGGSAQPARRSAARRQRAAPRRPAGVRIAPSRAALAERVRGSGASGRARGRRPGDRVGDLGVPVPGRLDPHRPARAAHDRRPAARAARPRPRVREEPAPVRDRGRPGVVARERAPGTAGRFGAAALARRTGPGPDLRAAPHQGPAHRAGGPPAPPVGHRRAAPVGADEIAR